MEKYKNKYQSESIRLQGYDYSSEGLYFLTICTKNRRPYLGKIKDQMVKLSSTGKIVAEEWKDTQNIRDRVQIGEWVIMPNHLHGIIHLCHKKGRDASNASHEKDGHSPSLHSRDDLDYKNEFGPQSDNISSIVRGFKSACTRRINKKVTNSFGWQTGFYDHIIRDQESLIKIEQYIRENPYLWTDDRYHC